MIGDALLSFGEVKPSQIVRVIEPLNLKGDILPDSRAKYTKGRIFTAAGTYIPFFCANCGRECGSCPEESMTFMFYLCKNCESTCGKIAGVMRLPDEEFWEKLRIEQLAHFGYYPTQDELKKVLEDDASPLATLLKEAR